MEGWVVWGTKSWDEFYGCLTFEKLICVLTTHEPTRSWRGGGGGGGAPPPRGVWGTYSGTSSRASTLARSSGAKNGWASTASRPGPCPFQPRCHPSNDNGLSGKVNQLNKSECKEKTANRFPPRAGEGDRSARTGGGPPAIAQPAAGVGLQETPQEVRCQGIHLCRAEGGGRCGRNTEEETRPERRPLHNCGLFRR